MDGRVGHTRVEPRRDRRGPELVEEDGVEEFQYKFGTSVTQ